MGKTHQAKIKLTPTEIGLYIDNYEYDDTANGLSPNSYIIYRYDRKNNGNGAKFYSYNVEISASDINSGTLPIARGGTGAITAQGARSNLGLTSWKSVSDWVTLASGWTASTMSVKYNAALGVVSVYGQLKTSVAQTAGDKTLGTVAATYRPRQTTSIPSLSSASPAVYVQPGGNLKANVSAISANG